MTRNLSYLIKLIYDKTYKGYVADVVNLYGCMSQGKTKKEALVNVKKAIRVYMEAMEKTTKEPTIKEIITLPVDIDFYRKPLYA